MIVPKILFSLVQKGSLKIPVSGGDRTDSGSGGGGAKE